MKKLVYPVEIIKDEESNYVASFPDLRVVTVGNSVEESYLMAQDYLQTYIDLMVKYDNEINPATPYLDLVEKNSKKIVLLSNAVVNKPEAVSDKEKSYRDFVRKFFTVED